MSKPLYQGGEQIVYRIYDPVEGKYCCSGRGLYASNGRSVWFIKGAATTAFSHLPTEIQARAEIVPCRLVPIQANGENP